MKNMRTRSKLLLFSLALATLAGFIYATFAPMKTIHIQAQTQTEETPFEIINHLAQVVNAGATQENINQLSSAVVSSLVVDGVSEADRNDLISRLTQAELAFRTSGSGALAEANAVNMTNWLADGLQAPVYAYTDETQVEYLRTLLNRAMPDLVRRKNMQMSPIEAFAVASVMLCQKMDNEEFMVTTSEFVTRIQTPTNYPIGNDSDSSYSVDVVPETPKQAEMRNTLNSNLQNFAEGESGDTLSVQNTLTALGIPAN